MTRIVFGGPAPDLDIEFQGDVMLVNGRMQCPWCGGGAGWCEFSGGLDRCEMRHEARGAAAALAAVPVVIVQSGGQL